MMADLMGDDIGLGEIAAGAEPVLELAIEAEVEIDLLVERAVERTHGGHRIAASRAHLIGEQDELGRGIALALRGENPLPAALGGAEDLGDESLLGIALLRAALLPWDLLIRDSSCGTVKPPPPPPLVRMSSGLMPKTSHNTSSKGDAAEPDAAAPAHRNTHAAAAAGKAEAPAHPPPIFDIVAAGFVIEAHGAAPGAWVC